MIDNKRTVAATYFNWKDSDYNEFGEPGASCEHTYNRLAFACPGCGRWGSIRAEAPKPSESPSWGITEGSLADPTTLTLVPSINCTGCCGWHGYLTKGVYRSC